MAHARLLAGLPSQNCTTRTPHAARRHTHAATRRAQSRQGYKYTCQQSRQRAFGRRTPPTHTHRIAQCCTKPYAVVVAGLHAATTRCSRTVPTASQRRQNLNHAPLGSWRHMQLCCHSVTPTHPHTHEHAHSRPPCANHSMCCCWSRARPQHAHTPRHTHQATHTRPYTRTGSPHAGTIAQVPHHTPASVPL
jgi:hypothetical protein